MPAPVFKLLAVAAPAAEPDADLLARFVSARDDDAFAELVRRHGPAVYHTCRRLVGPSAADDAFQATFLVLAARAGSVRKAASVGSWLVGVAGRVGRRMRVRNQRAEGREPRATDPDGVPAPGPSPDLGLLSSDLSATLTDEFTRLPDRLRAAAVACLVDGRTQEQAAAVLGWSSRTVRRRLDEAKGLLRARLERRGVTPAAAVAALGAVGEAVAVPAGLSRRATDAATLFLAGGGAHAPAAALAHGVIGTMRTLPVPAAAAACVAVLAGLGIGWAGDPQPPTQPPPAKTAPAATATPKIELIPPPTAKAPPAAPTLHTHKTTNFVVEAPTEAVARAIGEEFERQRKVVAVEWLGRELPAWKDPVAAKIEWMPSTPTAFLGDAHFRAVPNVNERSAISGTLDSILSKRIPHVVTFYVLTTHFGRFLPPWASCGPVTDEEARPFVVSARRMLEDGQALRLSRLFQVTMENRNVATGEQGFAVTRFLLTRTPDTRVAVYQGGGIGRLDHPPVLAPGQSVAKHGLLTFLLIGSEGNWESAAKEVYGFASVHDLERAWIDWMRGQQVAIPDPPADPDRIPPPGLTDHPAVSVGSVTARSKNFLVTAPTAPIATTAATEAERLWRELAKQWLGKNLPDRAELIPVKVVLQPGGSGGATTFTFGETDGKRPPEVKTVAMELRGPSPRAILTSTLPHEVMHVVLATHFGRPVPRWADEGISVLAESEEEQFNHEVRARELLNAGRGIRVATLLRMTEYPRDSIVMFAQGHSLCRFLMARGPSADGGGVGYPDGRVLRSVQYPGGPTGVRLVNFGYNDPRRALLAFVEVGSAGNTAESWAAAAKGVYGFDSLDALEQAWIESLREPPRRPGGDRPAAPTAPPPATRPAP